MIEVILVLIRFCEKYILNKFSGLMIIPEIILVC